MKTITDLRSYVGSLQRAGEVSSIAEALASDVRRRMSECLTERELVGIDYLNSFVYHEDPFVCGSHDYLDANMVVFDAVADFSERVIGVARDEFLEKALSAEEVQDADGAVLTLIKTGWDEVKRQGFSKLWREITDDDLRRDLGLLILSVPSSADTARALRHELETEYAAAHERVVGVSEELGRMAEPLKGDARSEAVDAFIEAVKDAKVHSFAP